MLRLFLNGKAIAVFVEFSNAISFRVIHPVPKNSCFLIFFSILYSLFEHSRKASSMEYIVPKDKTNRVITNKLFAYDEGQCKTIGRRLFGIRETDTIV